MFDLAVLNRIHSDFGERKDQNICYNVGVYRDAQEITAKTRMKTQEDELICNFLSHAQQASIEGKSATDVVISHRDDLRSYRKGKIFSHNKQLEFFSSLLSLDGVQNILVLSEEPNLDIIVVTSGDIEVFDAVTDIVVDYKISNRVYMTFACLNATQAKKFEDVCIEKI